jgi:hypothetical protein
MSQKLTLRLQTVIEMVEGRWAGSIAPQAIFQAYQEGYLRRYEVHRVGHADSALELGVYATDTRWSDGSAAKQFMCRVSRLSDVVEGFIGPSQGVPCARTDVLSNLFTARHRVIQNYWATDGGR